MNHYTSELLAERCTLMENYQKLYSQRLEAMTNYNPSLDEHLRAGEKQIPYATVASKKDKK